MTTTLTKHIGLSLGADICWPACYEEILKRLKLDLPIDGQNVRFETERVTVEPFRLRQPCKYQLVLDRLTHWFHLSREWIKKIVLMDGVYVLNNPWSLQSMEKHSTYTAMMHLGMPIPETWIIPPRHYETHADLEPTLQRYAKQWNLAEIGESLGYPFFMKPYDGGAWVGVTKIDSPQQLLDIYQESGRRIMHLQKAVNFDLFVRALGIGPQVNVMRYNPSAPLHARYEVAFHFVDGEEWSLLNDTALTINSYFGWDFNSCEALRDPSTGVFHPIDFANACPDSQVTSLHYHFPWLVKALLRWSLFCAATGRRMRRNLQWDRYEDIRKTDLSYRDKLARYAKLAHERYETERFVDFCQTHLKHLDEVALEFFGTDRAKDIFRQKVTALYPKHEIETFTDHFFGLVQFWRKTEADRLEKTNPDGFPEGIRL